MIFEHYSKVKERVGSQLAITKLTILTPVTAKSDYNFASNTSSHIQIPPSDPNKQ